MGVSVCAGQGGEEVLHQSTTEWLAGTGKPCQGAAGNCNCTTLKKENEKGVSFENEATLQVKVGGLLVCLSHFCWRPRILLYNGLSTFFITI